ncbi:hypothetical protein F5Y19DRAFT_419545, partial [Xylariaceae sp. FL1651]
MGGFDGIMVDRSYYEDDNMLLSRELVEYCNACGIITEAEPRRISGDEDGVADTVQLIQEIRTTPEQAEEFVALGV